MGPASALSTRALLTALAAVLCFFAIWQVAAEILQTKLGYFPSDSRSVEEFAAKAEAAATAASLGWPRGDLWVAHALADYAGNVDKARGNLAKETAAPNAAAATAVDIAPYDARSWLLMAAQEVDANRSHQLLTMSYYTAPASGSLFIPRLLIAMNHKPIDDELRSLVEFELGIVLKQDDSIKPALATTYLSLSVPDRSVLDGLIGAVDPNYLASIKK